MKSKSTVATWILASTVFVLLMGVLVLTAASTIFLKLQHLDTPSLLMAWWCWVPYWISYHQFSALRQSLLIAVSLPAALGAAFVLFTAASLLRKTPRLRPARSGQLAPAPVRALSDVHGNASWMTIKEALRLFPGPDPVYGGVVIGEAYRVDETVVAKVRFDPKSRATWGPGGKAPLLIDPCVGDATHGGVFAGSGGYKTTAIAVPTLTCWTGSAVIFDPACQLGPMTGALRQAMGHTVVTVGPGASGLNVLSWIEADDPLAEMHVQSVIDWIADEKSSATGENAIFKVRGKELLTCILADLLWSDAPSGLKTLREFRQRVRTPEKKMKGFLQDINAESRSSLARDLAGTLMDVFSETFSGIYSNANSDTQWLSVSAYADMLSDNSFSPTDLVHGSHTIFVQIPMSSLRTTPQLGKVVIGALLNAVYQAEGKVHGRVLFLLDEVNFLGKLKALEDARDAGRKYGITLVPMWQSFRQAQDTWGEKGMSAWISSMSWRLFSVVEDDSEATMIAKACGTYTTLKRSEGTSSGTNSGNNAGSSSRSRNQGLSEASRELIRPDEVRTRMRTDEQIVFRRGAPPLRCGRAIYFRRPEMVEAVTADRFSKAAE